jgi:hypothetical protein
MDEHNGEEKGTVRAAAAATATATVTVTVTVRVRVRASVGRRKRIVLGSGPNTSRVQAWLWSRSTVNS